MKKLIKPGKPMEDYSNDQVQAYCELEVCHKLCLLCYDVWGVDAEDDILF